MTSTPNSIDLTTLSAVKQWANAGIFPNISATVPSSSPYVIQTAAQEDLGVFYANATSGGAGEQFTAVDTAPSEGQYEFGNGLYEFAAADAGESILLNYIAPTPDDQQIQDCITAFSAYVLRLTGRGNFNGSLPTESPFVEPVTYDDFYDGSGTPRQPVRNWPITAVAAVIINGLTINQSTSVNTPGWVSDSDGRFIALRGGSSPYVATFQNYRNQGYGPHPNPGFTPGIQNVEIQYTAGFSGVPFDLEMAARKTVALNYKRRGWIGQRSQAMAQGAGTIMFGSWEMDTDCERTIMYYRRQNV